MNAVAKPKNEVAHVERLPAPPTAPTGQEMLVIALERGATPEVLAQVMTLIERQDATLARKAFNAAIAAAKAEIPVIRKNRHVGFDSKRTGDRTDYDHEDLAEIARTVDPILSKYGLGYRYRTEQQNGTIKVTCILFHRDGHSEENSLSGPNDTSGNKNAIQGIGSSQTFLQRYTLKAALGLAAASDDDANSAGGGEQAFITDEQVREISDLLKNTKSDLTRFLAKLGIPSLGNIYAHKFEDAKKLINETAAKRKALQAKDKEPAQ